MRPGSAHFASHLPCGALAVPQRTSTDVGFSEFHALKTRVQHLLGAGGGRR